MWRRRVKPEHYVIWRRPRLIIDVYTWSCRHSVIRSYRRHLLLRLLLLSLSRNTSYKLFLFWRTAVLRVLRLIILRSLRITALRHEILKSGRQLCGVSVVIWLTARGIDLRRLIRWRGYRAALHRRRLCCRCHRALLSVRQSCRLVHKRRSVRCWRRCCRCRRL